MMELFRRLQLQVLLISTVEKSTAIQPYCDITYSIVRHGDANAIVPFVRLSAEMRCAPEHPKQKEARCGVLLCLLIAAAERPRPR